MPGEFPKWESQLWSYLSNGDGMHCPVISHCQSRSDDTRCTDINQEELSRLIAGDGRSDPDSCERTRPCRSGVMPFIERLAETQLKKGGADCPPVSTDLVSQADEEHPVEVRTVHLKACCAATWRLRDGWVIQVADTGSASRNRIAVFHEAFHILAHCRSDAVPVFSKRGATQGHFNELMADYFAMCMLLPEQWVEQRWAEVRDIDQMAEVFEVPQSTMCLRLSELDLVR